METAIVLTPLVLAWLVAVARRRRDSSGVKSRNTFAEYFLSVLFNLVFTFGLRASATLSLRPDDDPIRQWTARGVALATFLFLLFLLLRSRGLLREAREATAEMADAEKKDPKTRVEVGRREHRAAEAVRYLTERYRRDSPACANGVRGATAAGLRPLRSQWQLVVYTRQLILFLLCYTMDLAADFASYELYSVTRYVLAAAAIGVLGGFWRLQAITQPYELRRQHWLEACLFATDIAAVGCACAYGVLTDDGAATDVAARVPLEWAIGLLLASSVVTTMLVVGYDALGEQWLIRQWYVTRALEISHCVCMCYL